MDDMARIWPLFVQFGGGAVLCLIGMWCGISSGYLDLKNREDKRLIGIIVGGFVFLLLLSMVFTFWLPNLPAEAAQ
jgi:hypothetical protein